MYPLMSNTAIGYAVISGTVLLAVIIYTVFKLRKQVKRTEEAERKKKKKP
ncbi:hypothetical protein [Salinimicrobium flavum]|uniref:CcmD family protein n=1 Tax=Salinimicrobium flavum TaxID=1737065 RepID=A0ABW5IXC3_9FLAO